MALEPLRHFEPADNYTEESESMSSEVNMNYPSEAVALREGAGRGDQVRQVFENTPRYLKSRQVDIRFRIDTVSAYASDLKRQRILYIGCGDGTISLQLLTPTTRLTLMDLSSNMLARAKTNIPEGLIDNVELRNENFQAAVFDSHPFDLIMSVGVMAHVDSPNDFLRKIRALLPVGGNLILEFTDAWHPVGRIGRLWGWMKELAAPAKYSTNKLSYAEMATLFQQNDLKLTTVFRYSRVPLPVFNRIFSYAAEYRLVKAIFGNCSKNRNAWLGNEYICLLSAQ